MIKKISIAKSLFVFMVLPLCATSLFASEPMPVGGQCYPLLREYLLPEIGEKWESLKPAFDQLTPAEQARYVGYMKGFKGREISFNLFQPVETMVWIYNKARKSRIAEHKYELFNFLLDGQKVTDLSIKAFTPGARLSTLEKRALIFMVERNYWYNVEWKTATLTGILFKSVAFWKWLPMLRSSKDSPFAQIYLKGNMPLRSIFGPAKIKHQSYTRLADLLENLPAKEEVIRNLDQTIKTLESSENQGYFVEQRILNLKLLKTSLDISPKERQQLQSELNKVLQGQSFGYAKAVLLETFPNLLKLPLKMNDRIMMSMWVFALASAGIVATVDFLAPEEEVEPVIEPLMGGDVSGGSELSRVERGIIERLGNAAGNTNSND